MASLFKRNKRWYITWFQDGQRKMQSTKTGDKRLAMEKLRRVEEERVRIALGLEPIDELKPLMLSEFIEIYQEDRQRIGKSAETIGIDTFALKDLLEFTSDCRIDTITTAAALSYRNHLLERVKPATASIRLRAIRSAFNWAVEKPGEKYLKVNHFAQKGIVPSVKEKRRMLSLTPDEKRRFFEAIDDPDHDLLYRFFLLTGCRRSEAVKLQWSDIDLEKKVITVRQTKTHRDRIIPINIELMQILMHLDRSKPRPFDYTPGWVTRLFKRYLRKAGLRKDLHLHCLRHTCATTLANRGIPPHKIKDFLGHSSIQVTEIYMHSTGDDLREVADALTCVG